MTKSYPQSIHDWLHHALEARPLGGVGGKGVFAHSPIPTGSKLAIFGGYVMRISDEPLLENNGADFALQIDEDFVIGARSEADMGDAQFFNHCCDPNAGFMGQIFLVAMRDIAQGEEVTFDYAMCLGDGPHIAPYSLECHCGSAQCRGWITDRDWTIAELQVRYRGFFQPYLQARIERSGLDY